MQQSIINKGKKSVPELGISKYREPYQDTRTVTDENRVHLFDVTSSIPQKPSKNPVINGQKTVYSHRSSLRHNEEGDLFQQFAGHNFSNVPLSREKKIEKESNSLEKWEK